MPSEAQADLFAGEDLGRMLLERIPRPKVAGVWVSLTETWCVVGYYAGFGSGAKRYTTGEGRDLEAALQATERAALDGGGE